MIPWEPGTAAMLADFRDEKGDAHPACPRSLLRTVIDRAAAMGFNAKFSCEFEFFSSTRRRTASTRRASAS